jgi:hypothetical protein
MRLSTAAVMMLAATLVLTAAHTALGQGASRTIKGTVVDSANQKPLSQAVIFLGRMTTAQHTGDDGTFRASAPTDPALLMVRRPGYVPGVLAIPAGDSATEADLGTMSMRKVKTDADRADAQNADMRMYPELAQFYDHKARYRQGLFLTPDDLQRVGGSLFTLIRQKPNFHFICYVTRRGDVDCGQEANRGRTSIMNPSPRSAEQEPCLMVLWTNALGPQRTLDEIQMDDVLAVEAYPHPGITPPEFTGSPCATIMLWMYHGGPVTARP